MPRGLYDRLTDHDKAPTSRYETATGRAEFVAEPGVSHEWRPAKRSAVAGDSAAAGERGGAAVTAGGLRPPAPGAARP